MIVTTKELFRHAYGKYAIGAYNINNLEQTMGLFRGNLDSQAPFIIQISKGARSYTHKNMLEGLIRSADDVFPDAIFAVHLDHGDEETCYDCINSGFYSSVMIDASHEPFEGNIATTKRVVEAVAVLLQLREGFLHPNPNLEKPLDPDCRFVGPRSREVRCRTALSNSFGFGGFNTSIVLQVN